MKHPKVFHFFILPRGLEPAKGVGKKHFSPCRNISKPRVLKELVRATGSSETLVERSPLKLENTKKPPFGGF
jgi:hypothetical protein